MIEETMMLKESYKQPYLLIQNIQGYNALYESPQMTSNIYPLRKCQQIQIENGKYTSRI